MIILHEVLKRLGFPFKVNFSLSKFLWVELTFYMASNILRYINAQLVVKQIWVYVTWSILPLMYETLKMNRST